MEARAQSSFFIYHVAWVTDGALNREFVDPAFGRDDRTLAP